MQVRQKDAPQQGTVIGLLSTPVHMLHSNGGDFISIGLELLMIDLIAVQNSNC